MIANNPDDAALERFLRDQLGVGGAHDDPGEWTVTTPLWIWRGSSDGPSAKAAWYFLTITGDAAAAIRAAVGGRTGGFGSVKVAAQIGNTHWTTSLFPSREAGGYLLPVKADVRRRERLVADVPATVALTLA